MSAIAVFMILTAYAQRDPVWAIGNRSVHFGGSSVPGITSKPLPIPDNNAVPAAYKYQGQVAQRVQHAEFDENGELLFFIIDGEIFNANGYRIVDAGLTPGDRNCRQCFYPGQEVHVFPRPGSCTQYFIISIYSAVDGTAVEPPALLTSQNWMRVGLLDLTAENQDEGFSNAGCNIRGAFLHELQRPGIGLLSNVSAFQPIEGDLVTDQTTFGYCVEGNFTGADAGSGLVRGATMQLEGDTRGLMFVIAEQRLASFILEPQGVRRLGTAGGSNTYPLSWYEFNPVTLVSEVVNSVEDNDVSFRGEMALRQVGSEVRLAYSLYTRFQYNGVGAFYHQPRVAYWEFQVFAPSVQEPTSLGFTMVPLDQADPNPKTYSPDLIPFDTAEPPEDVFGDIVAVPAIGGVEFSPNGRYIYFTKSAVGTTDFPSSTFGYIDLNVVCTPGENCPAFFYPTIGGVGDAQRLVDTQLEMNMSPDGTGPALYMIGAESDGDHWLSVFTGLDDPTNGTWEPWAFDLGPIAYRTAPDGSIEYRLLDRRVAGNRHFSKLQNKTCCEDLTLMRDVSKPIASNSQVWLPGSNPFCDSEGPLYFATDLVIPSGAGVYINHLELRFGPNARIIVERGALLSTNNSTFTSACERWPGIRVEGKTDNPVQVQTGSPVNRRQGWLYLNGSTVENAEVGVWCARESAPGVADPQYYGGVVRSVGSTFRNCTFGAKVENYTRLNGLTEMNNHCYFGGTEFVTTSAFPNATWEEPKVHVTLTAVRGIDLFNCRFKNTAPFTFLDQRRGKGIQARIASFRVRGNGEPNSSRFENLSIGITSRSSPLRPYEVDRTHFVNNMWGVYDLSSVASRITRNTFIVPDWNNFVRPPTGLYLHQSTGYLVEENTFQGFNRGNSFGIYFFGPQQADNRIYNNTFSNLLAGTMVSGRHKGNTPPFERQGLQLLCGDYDENTFDYALGSYTYIREDQGNVVDDSPENTQLAGNRWLDAADGSTTFDIWIDPEQHSGQGVNPTPFFDYKRHNVAVCDPLIPSPFYSDQVQDGYTEFNKEVDCGKGNLTPPPGPGTVSSRYLAVAAALKSAGSFFAGTVNDGGENLEILEAIAEERPALASHVLRDYLLARTPLHDDVMIAMLQRKTPMEAWHVTQVLLANCRLSSKVRATLDRVEYLSPYQLNLIANAEDGSQVLPLLQQEIAQLGSQKAKLQTHLLYDLLTDSTTANKYSTVVGLLAPNADLGDQFYLATLHLMVGEYQLLDQWLDSMEHKSTENVSVLRTLFQIRQAEAGTWPLIPASYANTLWDAYQLAESGSALAAALGFNHDFFDELPPIQIPDPTKSRYIERARSSSSPAAAPAFEVFPNPTSGTSYLVFQAETGSQRQLIMRDALGRVVQERLVPQGVLVYELSLGDLANGLYSCEVWEGGLSAGSLHVVVKK